jgi:hypothetical protein
VDAETGKYVAEMPASAKVSENVMHCNWSSPSSAAVNGKPMVFFAAGDGWVYGLGSGAERTEVDKDIFELPIKFKYDAVPPEYRKKEDGSPRKYSDFDGPSELIATPVYADGKLYVSIGQDPEHGEGVGMMSCIDVTQTGDLSGKAAWTFKTQERTISTPATHAAHHAITNADGVGHYKGNFGNLLFLWDVIFGTAHITRQYPAAVGLRDDQLFGQERWYRQMFYPLFQSDRECSALKFGGTIYDEAQAPSQATN